MKRVLLGLFAHIIFFSFGMESSLEVFYEHRAASFIQSFDRDVLLSLTQFLNDRIAVAEYYKSNLDGQFAKELPKDYLTLQKLFGEMNTENWRILIGLRLKCYSSHIKIFNQKEVKNLITKEMFTKVSPEDFHKKTQSINERERKLLFWQATIDFSKAILIYYENQLKQPSLHNKFSVY